MDTASNIISLFEPTGPDPPYDPDLALLRQALETNPTLINELKQLLVRPNPGPEVIRRALMDGVRAEGISVGAAFLDQFIKDLSMKDSKKVGRAFRMQSRLQEDADRLMTRNKVVQESLKNAGFDPGAVDGIIGPRTKAALTLFQHARSLPETGRLDPATIDALVGFGTTTGYRWVAKMPYFRR